MDYQMLTRTTRHLTPLVVVASLIAAPAYGVLVNKYTFNDGTVTDVQSGANGSLVDPAGIGFYKQGQFNLSNNNGANSNQDFFGDPNARGAYIDLPNGLISSAALNGNQYELSLEFWATVQENRDWARLGDFGSSNDGENFSTGADQQDYIIVVPQSGTLDDPLTEEAENDRYFAAATHDTGGNEFRVVDPAGPLSTGVEHHVVVTVNQFDTTGGMFPNGTVKLYLNRQLIRTGAVVDGSFFDATAINDVNNWLGRAQWADPLFDGSFNEFRVYSHALTQGEVEASFDAGATTGNEFAVPTLVIDRNTGSVQLINTDATQASITSYSISSESGSLNSAEWTTIDTGSFDPDGTWSASSTDPTLIAEAGTGNGGQIAATTGQAPIGDAWNPSPFEDAKFTFTITGGATLNGQVVYQGTSILKTDLDADGDLDQDDFVLFAAANQTDLTGLSDYELYKNGDLNGDGANNFLDFRMFKNAYIAENGLAAFSALFAAQVPEPASAVLVLAGFGLAVCGRRR